MRNINTAIITVALAFAHTASANTVSYQTGIIQAVDMEQNTITVLDNTGSTRTYAIPGKVNFVDNGMIVHDKTLIEPGRPIVMKFVKPGPAATLDSTIRGLVVRMDRATGKGSLREERTNKLVPFTVARELHENHDDMPRVGAYVELTYTVTDDNVANLE